MSEHFRSLQECLDFLEERALRVFQFARNSLVEHYYGEAIQSMRQSVEVVLKALVFHDKGDTQVAESFLANPERSKKIPSFIPATKLNNALQTEGLIQEEQKEFLLYFLHEGNAFSHANKNKADQALMEEAKVNFRKLLRWFYQRIAREVPQALQSAMEEKLPSREEQERARDFYTYFRKQKGLFEELVFQDEKGLRLCDIYV